MQFNQLAKALQEAIALRNLLFTETLLHISFFLL